MNVHNSQENLYLSVILPAYNESQRLPLTLVDVDRYLSSAGFTYEILVVNDGSKDTTAEIVRKMSGDIKRLRLIDNQDNKGKGGVVRQGMLAAQGRIRLFMDADNATSIDQFEKMRPFFTQGYDVVIGSRAMKGSVLKPPEPWYRQLAGRGGNLMIQALNVPGVWDTQCGFKAFSAKAASEIFTLSRVTGWGFDIECLALAHRSGYKIKEIPVVWVNQAGSKLKPGDYLKVFTENLKIRWWILTGTYTNRTPKSTVAG